MKGPKPLAFKVCPVCGITKPRSDYYRKGTTISHKCKPCSLVDIRSRSHRYIGKYRAYQNGWRRQRYETDQSYRDRIAQAKKASYDARIDAINAARRERWANDPFNPQRKHYRRKDVKDRTPPWVDVEAILAVYAMCPKGFEVDHIIPLKGLIDGRRVSGLHVPWNLQYLTPTQNRKKKNRITEQDISIFKSSDDVGVRTIGKSH